MSDQRANTVKKSTLIVACALTLVATVGILDWQGKIKHTEAKAQYILSEYKVVMIPEKTEDQDTEVYRLSPKPSHQSAFCQEGYVFLRSDKNAGMEGLLVDYKNRGVKCAQTLVTPTVPVDKKGTTHEP